MSLHPPLLGSTFQARTVVSMFGRLCHLFVHALCSLQVANAKCMTLCSLTLVSAQRAKSTGSQQEKTLERKKLRLAAGKNALQRKKTASAAREKASKKCLAAEKNQSSKKKHLAAAKKAPLQQKYILEAAGKNRPRREKTRPRKKNPRKAGKQIRSRESPALQPKSRCNGKIYFRNGKKQQPKWSLLFTAYAIARTVPSANRPNRRRKSSRSGVQMEKLLRAWCGRRSTQSLLEEPVRVVAAGAAGFCVADEFSCGRHSI